MLAGVVADRGDDAGNGDFCSTAGDQQSGLTGGPSFGTQIRSRVFSSMRQRIDGNGFPSASSKFRRAGDSAIGLFDEGEKPQVRGPGENQFVPFDQEKAEAAYFAK